MDSQELIDTAETKTTLILSKTLIFREAKPSTTSVVRSIPPSKYICVCIYMLGIFFLLQPKVRLVFTFYVLGTVIAANFPGKSCPGAPFSRETMSDALINGLAGAGGGIIAQLITYPLQTVSRRDPLALASPLFNQRSFALLG